MYSGAVVEDTASPFSDDCRYSVSSFMSEAADDSGILHIIPPPQDFKNSESVKPTEASTPVKRYDRPLIPAKPQFMASRNMNNNNRIQTQMAAQYGTTKLKNLMLLRQPPIRKPMRRTYSSDSCDSLSDTDDSNDESEVSSKKEDTSSIDGVSTISSISTSSIEHMKEETNGSFVVVRIAIPEQKLTKCMQLKVTETVWTAKQRIIQSLAKKFSDPLNYGLYHEKLGAFLLDHKPMSEYIETGCVGTLQMRYKCRRMEDYRHNSKEGRHIAKMHSASKRRDFIKHVQQFETDKIYAFIRKGMDPNFHCPNTGETPLTIVSNAPSRPECVSVFMALMGGGAHLDFRNQRGFTPMHVAARSGNTQMLKTLLEFHASPNVVDGRDLTPLYHCILLGSDPAAARILIEHDCTIECCDSQGWSEVHQACRHGRIQLLELLLAYESFDIAMVNARNASGNTPLHVCALYNQEMCAVILLRHGADASVRNFTNQDAFQVAHVAGNVSVAQLINEYHTHRDEEHPLLRMRAESIAEVPNRTPPSPMRDRVEKKQNLRATWTPNTVMKHCQRYMLQKQQSVGGTLGRNKESYTVTEFENRFDSSLPPNAKIPETKQTKASTNGTSDDNNVRIVVRNYDAQTPDELSLTVGTRVIVLNTRNPPADFYDGMVGNRRGFFPENCVEQVRLRRPYPDTGQRVAGDSALRNGDHTYQHSNGKYASADTTMMKNNMMSDSISLVSFESGEDGTSASPGGRRPSARSDELAQLQPTSVSGIYHNRRSVNLWKGDDGFGFILRGAKSEGPVHEFDPTAKVPGLQYLESIEEGSNAHSAGLRCGDYIVRIGETDVRRFGHQQLVETIRACGQPLHMQVVTVVHRKPSEDTASLQSNSSGRQRAHGKSDSIASALDQLDHVIALEDSDGSDQTATLRRLPGSRKPRSEDLQNLFARQSTSGENQSSIQRHSSQQSTFSSARRPIRVLPPSLSSAGVNNSYENSDQFSPTAASDTTSLRSMSSTSSSSSTFTTWGRNSAAPVSAPPTQNVPFKAYTVSAATGDRMFVPNGQKHRKMPPPPPKRINSRLSVTIPEEGANAVKNTAVASPPHSGYKSTQQTSNPNPVQSDMAIQIAMAARSRAERASISEEKTKPIKQTTPQEASSNPEENHIESPAPRSVAQISAALSIALAAKQKILDQRTPGKTPTVEMKKPPSTSFTVDPNKSSISKSNPPWKITNKVPAAPIVTLSDRNMVSPPPSYLPPPPPPSDDADEVTGLALPPPPSFPAPDPHSEHHTRYSNFTFDELMSLPPPPSDLLPSPVSHHAPSKNIKPPEEFRKPEGKLKPTSLGLLPPPPVPPPMDDEDDGGCTSPTGVDSLSNADSGVADVAGDGLNSSGHRSTLSDHHGHDHVVGDNHSTVSSVSTISTLSSEDGGSDYVPASSSVSERSWPLREVRTTSSEDSKSKESPPTTPAGNMYLNVLKKAKNKSSAVAPSSSATYDTKKNLRPGITVTKMTFAPITSLPPPVEESSESRPRAASVPFPPTPKEYATTTAAKNPAQKPARIQTKRLDFAPKTITPLVKPVEKSVPKLTEVEATKTSENSANNNPSPEKKVSSVSSNKKPISQWTVKDVSDWLRELQLEMYIPMFEENEISGEHLPDLGKGELMELGVKAVGHRLTIDRSVKKLVKLDT